ncbi:TerB family tellurite resistance protein [Pseudorhodobacter ferrugineus]|uniref:TerB family tellurite resistance protein n=1 Tax=Pseudorhodobacter ferrugineus TaxID=77008 RepID=UPI0003B58A2F|nr:TerB family tellurite resistance protein [Pseudorhodobacter ferrugineus]
MFFIVWGFKGRPSETAVGRFYCPDCGDHRNYRKMTVKRWFTLYWIPLFQTSTLGDYIECKTCKATYSEQVLNFDPITSQQKFEAAFAVAAKRVMFKMALADGDIDAAEVAQIAQAFGNIVKRGVDPADIEAELEAAHEDTRSITDYLAEVSAGLNDTGKELVLRSAIAVAKADGVVDPSEEIELHALAVALDFPTAYANGVFAEEGIAMIKRRAA